MSPRAMIPAIAGAVWSVLAGGGCSSISLRATEARMPILLGPVACIGCAPQPARGAAPPTVAGRVRERDIAITVFGGKTTEGTVPLDIAATKAVSDPCREDVHVAGIQTGAWGFDVVLLFGLLDTWVDVQASRAPVPSGTCGHTPSPSAGPAGIVGATSDKPRDGRRP